MVGCTDPTTDARPRPGSRATGRGTTAPSSPACVAARTSWRSSTTWPGGWPRCTTPGRCSTRSPARPAASSGWTSPTSCCCAPADCGSRSSTARWARRCAASSSSPDRVSVGRCSPPGVRCGASATCTTTASRTPRGSTPRRSASSSAGSSASRWSWARRPSASSSPPSDDPASSPTTTSSCSRGWPRTRRWPCAPPTCSTASGPPPPSCGPPTPPWRRWVRAGAGPVTCATC